MILSDDLAARSGRKGEMPSPTGLIRFLGTGQKFAGEPHFGRGRVAPHRGDPNGALGGLQQVIAPGLHTATLPNAYNGLGEAHIRLEGFEKARVAHQQSSP